MGLIKYESHSGYISVRVTAIPQEFNIVRKAEHNYETIL